MSKQKILILANNDVGLYKFRKELIQELLCPGSIVDGRSGNGAEVYIALPDGGIACGLQATYCMPCTDKNIIRYFMTTPEAVSLVLQVGAYAKGQKFLSLIWENRLRLMIWREISFVCQDMNRM